MRTPLFNGTKEEIPDYVGSLNTALFTNPNTFIPESTGFTGDASASLVATGRHLDVTIEVTGASSASSGTMALPVQPLYRTAFRAVTVASPSVDLGPCLLGLDGVLSLPDWSTANDVLIFGTVVEG
jgi:hypothetical protein